jgi:hypothetical protein
MELGTMSKAQDNARKITELLVNHAGYADLYRTCTAGPSGQRGAKCVARVRYVELDCYEVQIFTPGEHNEAGFAARSSGGKHAGMWTFWEDNGNDGIALLGWASSLSLGADVLVNGAHAATGRHDSARTSAGKWEAYTPRDV